MVNLSPNNKPRPRSVIFSNAKPLPRLSLNLHIMPQTSDGHFKQWLILGLLIFGLMVIIALLLLW